ncbi:hypothetical protein PENSPDRAFT_694867 [Peniophora sp. CONT]|nr:hypothetical protein PENSPDRAFT_694867 [Peniophora sp. CONT]
MDLSPPTDSAFAFIPPIGRLPVEVLLFIIRYLSVSDIISFAACCHFFLNVCLLDHLYLVRRSIQLYGHRISRARVSPPAGVVRFLLTRLEFDNLLQTEYGMRYVQLVGLPSFGSVPNPSDVFAVCDGFLIHAQVNIALRFQGFTSAVLFYAHEVAAPLLSFPVFFPVLDILALAIEPYVDMIALLAPFVHGGTVIARRYEVLFRSLSSHGRCSHPNARIINFLTRFDLNTDTLARRFLLAGSLLLVHLADASDFTTAFVGLMNWRDGQDSLISIQLPGGAVDVAWLTLHIFIVTTLSGSIYVFKIVHFSPLTIFLMAELCIPRMRPGLTLDVFNVVVSSACARVFDGLLGIDSVYNTLFAAEHGIVEPVTTPDPRRGLLVVTLAPSDPHGIPENAYSVVFRLSNILSLFWIRFHVTRHTHLIGSGNHDVHFLLAWRVFRAERWFNYASRVFRNPNLNDFTHGVVGCRVAQSVGINHPLVAGALARYRLEGEDVPRDCVLFADFNQETVPPPDVSAWAVGSASSLAGHGDWAPVHDVDADERVVTRPSILAGGDEDQRVFRDNVVSTLPYRQVVSAPQGTITYLAVDDHRLWLMAWFPETERVFWEVRAFR